MPTLGDTAQTDPVDLSEPAGRPIQSGCESPLRPAASLNLNAQCGGFPAERTLALGCTSFIQAMPSSLSTAVRVGRSPRVKLPTWRFASLPHRTHKLMDQRNRGTICGLLRGAPAFYRRGVKLVPFQEDWSSARLRVGPGNGPFRLSPGLRDRSFTNTRNPRFGGRRPHPARAQAKGPVRLAQD